MTTITRRAAVRSLVGAGALTGFSNAAAAASVAASTSGNLTDLGAELKVALEASDVAGSALSESEKVYYSHKANGRVPHEVIASRDAASDAFAATNDAVDGICERIYEIRATTTADLEIKQRALVWHIGAPKYDFMGLQDAVERFGDAETRAALSLLKDLRSLLS